MVNTVEKHFEVQICEYTLADLDKVENRLNEIDNQIKVTELGKCDDSANYKLKVTYWEQEDKNELEQTIVNTLQFSDLWNKCIKK